MGEKPTGGLRLPSAREGEERVKKEQHSCQGEHRDEPSRPPAGRRDRDRAFELSW